MPQTAIVLFDGVPAYDVRVFSGALLSATPPPHTPGVVDVSVQNVDQTTGVPISGEVVVAASSFTYVLPRVTADYPSDLVALVRTLIRAMKAYLLIEITHAVHTDYDERTGDELHVTKFAKLPGITLIGPDLEENRFYSLNEEPDFTDETTVGDDGQPSAFVGTKVPYTVDLTFKVIAASDSKIELLNLASNFVMFMHSTKYLPMARNAADPSAGTIAYEFDFVKGGQPKTARIHSTEENKFEPPLMGGADHRARLRHRDRVRRAQRLDGRRPQRGHRPARLHRRREPTGARADDSASPPRNPLTGAC